jgi:hypothetical protein
MLENVGVVASVVGSFAVVAPAIGAGLLWIFRRGQASGRGQAEREAQRRAQDESMAERRAMRNQLVAVENELAALRGRIARQEIPLPRGQEPHSQSRQKDLAVSRSCTPGCCALSMSLTILWWSVSH